MQQKYCDHGRSTTVFRITRLIPRARSSWGSVGKPSRQGDRVGWHQDLQGPALCLAAVDLDAPPVLRDQHVVLQRVEVPVNDPFGAADVILGRAREHLDHDCRRAHLILGQVDRTTDDDGIRIHRRGRGRGHDLRAFGHRAAAAAAQMGAQGGEHVALDDGVRVGAADPHPDHAADKLVAFRLPAFPGEEIRDRPRLGQRLTHALVGMAPLSCSERA
jgi:hypothetical protein